MEYESKKKQLAEQLRDLDGPIIIKKKSVSNLFRYKAPQMADGRQVDLSGFNQVIALDIKTQLLEVEGLTRFEDIVDFCLPHGVLPKVTPELKNITIGGATVGIGIETTCHKYGFVHDTIVEADVLTPTGEILTCNKTKHTDLFHALANSYGTLGYILRVKVQLHKIKPFVKLTSVVCTSPKAFLAKMKAAAQDDRIDFVEGLLYSPSKLCFTTSVMVDQAPKIHDIYHGIPFYKAISEPGDVYLPLKDYIFRYDPDWFWNFPEKGVYGVIRRLLPKSLRCSGFYTKYLNWQKKWGLRKDNPDTELLIQDWEVPWRKAEKLLDVALNQVDIYGQPWTAVPIKSPGTSTLYPVKKNALYFNLGCYCGARKKKDKEEFYYTKLLDNLCFALGGIKMLYSSSFIDKKRFDKIYNGRAYAQLKKKYDPKNYAGQLYEKAIGK